MTRAPNFDRTPLGGGTYPEKGKLIGPVWQLLWDLMDDDRWHPLADLHAAVVLEFEASVKTTSGLLWGASRSGLLRKRLVRSAGDRVPKVQYRRVDTRETR